MKISVIIPCYNEEQTILKVIRSVQESLKEDEYEIIIVDVGEIGKVDAIQRSFDLLVPGGLILTSEPEVPVDDVGEIPSTGPENPEQARVVAFNEWTRFITEIGATNPVGFIPLFGGTLVGIIQA